MSTTKQWFCYFKNNLEMERINWNQPPGISQAEIKRILKSLQAWQLGETSDGKNLLKACSKYATKTGDLHYVKTMELFIKEEQKHGNNLGRYLDIIGQPRIKKDWGDSLFRKIRGFNTSMELWTLAVITIENAAQIFYQALKDATQCKLLKEITGMQAGSFLQIRGKKMFIPSMQIHLLSLLELSQGAKQNQWQANYFQIVHWPLPPFIFNIISTWPLLRLVLGMII